MCIIIIVRCTHTGRGVQSNTRPHSTHIHSHMACGWHLALAGMWLVPCLAGSMWRMAGGVWLVTRRPYLYNPAPPTRLHHTRVLPPRLHTPLHYPLPIRNNATSPKTPSSTRPPPARPPRRLTESTAAIRHPRTRCGVAHTASQNLCSPIASEKCPPQWRWRVFCCRCKGWWQTTGRTAGRRR